MSNMSKESLSALDHDDLVTLVLSLHKDNCVLKTSADEMIASKYEKRLEDLERAINENLQYGRRDTCDISGISMDINDADIEEECLKILKTAKVKVSNRFPNSLDIHAAHRKGKKGVVIIKFVNRKWANTARYNSSNLKNSDYQGVYINPSFCPEFGYLNFAVRKAKANGEINHYKLKNGLTFIQKAADDRYVKISHVNDLERYGLTVPPRTVFPRT